MCRVVRDRKAGFTTARDAACRHYAVILQDRARLALVVKGGRIVANRHGGGARATDRAAGVGEYWDCLTPADSGDVRSDEAASAAPVGRIEPGPVSGEDGLGHGVRP